MNYTNQLDHTLCDTERSLIIEALEHEIDYTTKELSNKCLRTFVMNNAQKLLDLNETIKRIKAVKEKELKRLGE